MPILANAKHEKFAQGIVSGLDQTAAYVAAGYRGSPGALMANASRLIRADKVLSRIAELNAPALAVVQAEADEAVASAAWIIREAVRVVAEAKPKDRVPALALLARRHPEFRDTAGNTDPAQHLHLHFENLTIEELRGLAGRR